MKAFVSYKSEDNEHVDWVTRFATDLRNNGIEAILDRWEVPFGASFSTFMTNKLKDADAILLVISPGFVLAAEAEDGRGGAVQFEVQFANARRLAGERTRLIPIYRRNCTMLSHLRDHRYADFRNDANYSESMGALVRDLLNQHDRPPVVKEEDEDGERLYDTGRGGAQVETYVGTQGIDVTLNVDYDSFTPEKQRHVIRAIKEFLALEADIKIVKKRKGSTILTLALTPEHAERLYWAIKRGELEDVGAVDAMLLDKLVKRKPKKRGGAAKKSKTLSAKRLQPDSTLAVIVGSRPLTRSEIFMRLWDYIRKNKLQDPQNRLKIYTDAALKAVCNDENQVSRFAMKKHVSRHVS